MFSMIHRSLLVLICLSCTPPSRADATRDVTVRPKLDAYGDPLPPGAFMRIGTHRFRIGRTIALTFLPQRAALASVSRAGNLSLWSMDTGLATKEDCLSETGIDTAVFSPNGSHVFIETRHGEGQLWKVSPPKLIRTLYRGTNSPNVQFDGSGLLIAGDSLGIKDTNIGLNTFSTEGIGVQDVNSGRALGFILARKARTHFGFSSTKDEVVLVSPETGKIEVKSISSGKLLRKTHEIGQPIWMTVTSPSCNLIAIVPARQRSSNVLTASNYVLLYDTRVDAIVSRIDFAGSWIQNLLFTKDDASIMVGNNDEMLRWDIRTHSSSAPWTSVLGAGVPVALSLDDKMLASVNSEGVLRLWNVETAREFTKSSSTFTGASSITLSPDAASIATANVGEKRIELWNAKSALQQQELRSATELTSRPIWFSSHGKSILSAKESSDVGVWDTKSGKQISRMNLISTFFCNEKGVFGADLDVSRLVHWSLLSSSTLDFWTLPQKGPLPIGISLKEDRVLFFESDKVYTDGSDERKHRFVVISKGERLIRIQNLKSGREIGRNLIPSKIESLRNGISCCVSSPDTALMAFAASNSNQSSPRPARCVVIDTKSNSVTEFGQDLADQISCMCFSADGKVLATAELNSGLIRLWEVATGRQFAAFSGHNSRVLDLCFAPDFGAIYSAGLDTTVLGWDLFDNGCFPRRGNLDGKEQRECLDALGNPDPVVAQNAIRKLRSEPEICLTILKEILVPLSKSRLAYLVGELDSKNFSARENASLELRRSAGCAEERLSRIKGESRSPEVRARLGAILQELGDIQGPARLRRIRATQLLGLLKTREAELFRSALRGEDVTPSPAK